MHIIIQARLSSSRLPKKVLLKINNEPMIQYLINRLKKINSVKICIATSNHNSDNKIEDYCNKNNISCFRGSLDNVAKRMLQAAKYLKADAFVRINADSPFIDPKIICRGIKLYKSDNCDLVSNVFPRSYPIGQSVEVIKTSTFEKVFDLMYAKEHFEHITKYYYENYNEAKIINFSNELDLSAYRLVLDTRDDLDRLKIILKRMTKPPEDYNLNELIQLYPSA